MVTSPTEPHLAPSSHRPPEGGGLDAAGLRAVPAPLETFVVDWQLGYSEGEVP